MAGPGHCSGRHRRRRTVRLRRFHRSPSTTATCCPTRTRACTRWPKSDEQISSRSLHPCSAPFPSGSKHGWDRAQSGAKHGRLPWSSSWGEPSRAARPTRHAGPDAWADPPAGCPHGGQPAAHAGDFRPGPVQFGVLKTSGHSRRSGRGLCAQPDATRAPTLRTVHSPCIRWATQVMCPPPSGSWKAAGSRPRESFARGNPACARNSASAAFRQHRPRPPPSGSASGP